MEAIKMEAIKTKTIIERKILIRRESIDILKFLNIAMTYFFCVFVCKIGNPTGELPKKQKSQ